MQIGIVGKPNVGKTTFFNAATCADAEMANYPFTTIDANRGVIYARTCCPCKEHEMMCHPNHGKCIQGIRYVPIEAIDVAGLVPKETRIDTLAWRFVGAGHHELTRAHPLALRNSGVLDLEELPVRFEDDAEGDLLQAVARPGDLVGLVASQAVVQVVKGLEDHRIRPVLSPAVGRR